MQKYRVGRGGKRRRSIPTIDAAILACVITPDHGFTSIEALENAIAAILAADDAARILALRARTTADLLEADLIRQKLAMVWFALVSEREARRLASPQSVAARRSG